MLGQILKANTQDVFVFASINDQTLSEKHMRFFQVLYLFFSKKKPLQKSTFS
jgi:hypothetical protein